MTLSNVDAISIGQMINHYENYKRICALEDRDKRLRELDKLQLNVEVDALMPIGNARLLNEFKEKNPTVYEFREEIVMQRMKDMNYRCGA